MNSNPTTAYPARRPVPIDGSTPAESASRPALDHVLSSSILVVDDQPANIQVVGSVLGKLGHEIIPASDGPTAFKRLGLRAPDLILLDLLMPEMNGYEVCQRLKENPDWKDIPVIFLSAADDKDLIVQALNAGGVDYITKPFNQAELISRVRTQLALKYARDHLKQLAEDKDELLGILAHDLKSHLGGMEMSAQLLRNRILGLKHPDERSLQLSENISHTSGQLLAFVKEFLANAAADYGVTLKPETLNLNDAVAAAVRQYGEAAERKKLKILTDFPKKEILVQADPSGLDQVLDNLLSNALKFSPPGRSIYVSVRRNKNLAECLIQDQGPGFTDEDRTRMFRRYGRLSARPTGNEPSTGLGLSIVRKLVQAMNGTLVCESTPGNGATFIIRLNCLTTK
jgi:two-component system sensor histidine kinase/response regulator